MEPGLDAGQGARDLAGDEGFAAQGRLMIEENAVATVDAVSLTIIHRDPVGVELSYGIRRSRIERRGLSLWNLLHKTIKLRGGGLVETRLLLEAKDADGFKEAQR